MLVCVGVLLLTTSVMNAQPISLDRMEFVGQWGFGPYSSVASRGDITIFGCGASLRIFDTTNPEEMYEISHLQILSKATDLIIRGDVVFATTEPELLTIDVADPSQPRIIGREQWRGRGGPIALNDDYLFVSCRDSVVRVFDVANFEQIAFVDSLVLDGFYSKSIEIGKDLIFLALEIIRDAIMTVRWSPETGFNEIAEYNVKTDGQVTLGNGFGITGDWRIFIFDEDTLQETAFISNDLHAGNFGDAIVFDTLILAKAAGGPFFVINSSDPFNPSVLGSTDEDIKVNISKFAYSSNYCYGFVTNSRTLLSVENLRQPESIISVEDAGGVSGIESVDGGLFVVNGQVIRSLDVHDFRAPFALDSVYLPSEHWGGPHRIFCADEGVLYVQMDNYAASIDIENPDDIFFIEAALCDFPDGRAHMEVKNGLGLASDYHNLYSFDLSDPGHFVPLDTLDLRAPYAIGFVNEEYAYVADDYSANFYIINISDPSNLSVVSQFRLGSDAFDFCIDGDIAYVAAYSGLAVLDVSNPVAPRVINTFVPDANPRAVKQVIKSDSLLYAIGARGQVWIFNASNPYDIELVGFADLQIVGITGTVGDDKSLYIASSPQGVYILRHTSLNYVNPFQSPEQPNGFGISCFPNPLNGVGTVRLSVPWVKQGTVALYSLNGREIAAFTTSPSTVGRQNMAVDFSRFASGSYFIKYQADDIAIQSKIVIIR